jgi:hypothetical protein
VRNADGTQKYGGIAPMIQNAAGKLNLSDAQAADLLMSSRGPLDKKLELLEASFGRRANQKEPPQWRQSAYRTFRRTSLLTTAIETGRREGIASVTASAFSLASAGQASLFDTIAGENAPMAHALAASRRNPANEDPAMAARLHAARAETERKVYRVMVNLRKVASTEFLVISPGSFNLQEFAAAVERYLLATISKDPARILDQLEVELAAKLAVFLETMNAR